MHRGFSSCSPLIYGNYHSHRENSIGNIICHNVMPKFVSGDVLEKLENGA